MIMLFFRIFRDSNTAINFIRGAADFEANIVMKLLVVVCAQNAMRVRVSVACAVNFYFVTCQRFVIRKQSLYMDFVSWFKHLVLCWQGDVYRWFFLIQSVVVVAVTSDK